MNETKIELNEYIHLTIKTPEETDIATYDGINEMVRKINKAVGTILPTKRKYNRRITSTKNHWNKERAEAFIQDSYQIPPATVMKKYNLTTIESSIKFYVQKRRSYLRSKYNIKDKRAHKSGPIKL